jgi:hypothetical protein
LVETRPTGAPAGGGEATARPIGALFALTCDGAGWSDPLAQDGSARSPDPASFAARTVALGAAGAVLAAIGSVDHAINREVAALVAAAIADGCPTLADVIAHVARVPRGAAGLGAFRIIGDPLAGIAGEHEAWNRVSAVSAGGAVSAVSAVAAVAAGDGDPRRAPPPAIWPSSSVPPGLAP